MPRLRSIVGGISRNKKSKGSMYMGPVSKVNSRNQETVDSYSMPEDTWKFEAKSMNSTVYKLLHKNIIQMISQ